MSQQQPGDRAASAQAYHTAVIVVHGVGAAEAGDATTTLVHALASKGLVLEQHLEVVRLPETVTPDDDHPNPKRRKPQFPVVMQEAHLAPDHKVTFAELYWADLTRIGTGRIRSLLSLFQVIIEAHYIIDAMLARRGLIQRVLQFILLWLSWLMRGPAVGFTACTAAVLAAALYIRPDGPLASLTASPPLQCAAALVAVLLAALGLRAWIATRRLPTWENSLNWVMIVAVLELIGLGVLARYHVQMQPLLGLYWLVPADPARLLELSWLVRAAYELTVELWRFWSYFWLLCLLLLALVGILALGLRRYRPTFVQALTATGILSLQFLLWTAIVGTVVLPLIMRAREVVAITELKAFVIDRSAVASERDVGDVVARLKAEERRQAFLRDLAEKGSVSTEVGDLLNVSALRKADHAWISRFVRAYGFNNMVALAFVGFALVIYRRRKAIAKAAVRHRADLSAAAGRVPRLLFSGPLLAVLLLLTLVHVTMIVVGAFLVHYSATVQAVARELEESRPWLQYALQATRELGGNFWGGLLGEPVFTIGVASAALLPFMTGRSLDNAVHIARDLIDHQSGPLEGRTWKIGMRRETDPEKRWPRRARIARRLRGILAEVTQRRRADRIILVAHSQGTVVAYDYLKAVAETRRSEPFPVAGVITLGSPLTHLYEHYYHEYAGVKDALAALAPATGRWINFYRIDDYVGQWIDEPASSVVDNRPLEPGGHINYWKEPRVSEAVIELLRRPAR